MKPTHPCSIPNCPEQLAGKKAMCAAHWNLVPDPLKAKIGIYGRQMGQGVPAAKAAYNRSLEKAIECVEVSNEPRK